jgi:hypothetical protein
MTFLGQIDRGGGDDYDQHDVMDKTRARTHNSCRNRALKRRSRSTPKQEQGRTKIFFGKGSGEKLCLAGLRGNLQAPHDWT